MNTPAKNSYTTPLEPSEVQALVDRLNQEAFKTPEVVDTIIFEAGLYGHITSSKLYGHGDGYSVLLNRKWLLYREGNQMRFTDITPYLKQKPLPKLTAEQEGVELSEVEA